MKVLAVYAHESPTSFNAAMKEVAISTFRELGYQVKLSDLYAMNFKAVADKNDFTRQSDSPMYKYQIEGMHALKNNTFSSDIFAEQEKIRWADFILFQFPIWWFSMPGILKGWFDRVFSMGFAYGGDVGIYNDGGLKGKKAMIAVTTGGPQPLYNPRGMNGDINKILYPIQHGILYFSGMDVLPPFIAWSVAHFNDKQRKDYLKKYKGRLLNLEIAEPIPFHPNSTYDENMQLKKGLKPEI